MRSKTGAYLELIRYPLLAIPIAASLPGIVLAAAEVGINWRVFAAPATALCGYFAGMIKNDYFHREHDRAANPDRPLPSGRARPKTAHRLASGMYIACVLSGFAMGWRAGLLTMCLVAVSHSYNAYLKMRGVWGSVALPFGIALLSVYGSVCVSGGVSPGVWFCFATIFLYDAGVHIISAFKDMERDKALGVVTTPLQIGARRAMAVSWIMTAGAFAAALTFALRVGSAAQGACVGLAFAVAVWTRLPLLREASEKNGYAALKGSMIGAALLFPSPIAGVLPFWWAAGTVAALAGLTAVLLGRSRQEV